MFELYDCFSIATAIQLEALGITKPGGSLDAIAGGQLDVDGSLPTNTHGGLLSHGYLLGAGHVAEAVRQLRHEACGNQVREAASAFVGAGPGRQYTGLLLRRTDA
jgi:acetyl-CoA acetyltransferase